MVKSTWYLNLEEKTLSTTKHNSNWKSIGSFKPKKIKKFAEGNGYTFAGK